MLTICTIITKSHLVYARTLLQSLQKYNEDVKFYVLLADQVDGYFEPKDYDFSWIFLEDLCDQEIVRQMCFYYSAFELCCALRGHLHQYLYQNTDIDKWVFLDSDIMVCGSLEPIFQELENHSILLTAHCDMPVDNEYVYPHEVNFLRVGTFNAGFLGLSRSSTTWGFIEWFKNRLTKFCFNDLAISEPRSLFVDQLWLNLVPQFFSGVSVFSHPGANLGHWNLYHKKLEIEQYDKVLVDGEPLLFVHFSGWDINNPDEISKYSPMYQGKRSTIWSMLAKTYLESLLRNDYPTSIKYPYAFTHYSTGETITLAARRHYYLELQQGLSLSESPFAFSKNVSSFLSHTESIALLKEEIESVRSELDCLTQANNQLKTTIQTSQSDLHELSQRNTELEKTLQTNHSDLHELSQRNTELEKTLKAIEISKFWRLRNLWFKIKILLRLPTSKQII